MAVINLKIKKSVFNDAYYPYLFDYSRRYEVYYGGAGSGKSVWLGQKLVSKACGSVRKVLIIRKVGNTLRHSVYELIKQRLIAWKLWGRCSHTANPFFIELPNGSQFIFSGLDDSEKIKSITDITDIWVEEGTELTSDEFDQLDLRLRAMVPNLQMFISFNPVSKVNWVYKRWFAEDAPYEREKTLVLKTTYKDNRFLTQDYIDSLEAKARTNPTYHKIYALGDFCSLDKLVFNNWHVQEFDHASINGKLLVGLDFGFVNDISALVASVLDEQAGRIYVFREWGDTNKTNDQLASIIDGLGFRKSLIIADAAEPKSIEEIRRKGITKIRECVKGPDSIIHGIQKLQQYELVIHPSCAGLLTELENYAWQKDKKTGEYLNKPIDAFNHYIDALRYSLQCVNDRKLKTLNKSALGL